MEATVFYHPFCNFTHFFGLFKPHFLDFFDLIRHLRWGLGWENELAVVMLVTHSQHVFPPSSVCRALQYIAYHRNTGQLRMDTKASVVVNCLEVTGTVYI